MYWVRLGFGVVLSVVGVVWILQGFNVVKGSGMSGHGEWAVGGVVVLVCGVWLLWGVVKPRRGLLRS